VTKLLRNQLNNTYQVFAR